MNGHKFNATNKLLTSYEGATGVKTGHTTDAGYCLVGSATRGGRSVIVAVLGAPTDQARIDGARRCWTGHSPGSLGDSSFVCLCGYHSGTRAGASMGMSTGARGGRWYTTNWASSAAPCTSACLVRRAQLLFGSRWRWRHRS